MRSAIIIFMKKSLVLVLALFILGCADEVKKPSEDSLIAQEAFALAEEMRRVYVAKNFWALKEYTLPETYGNVVRDIKKFRSVKLEFTPRWVEIKKDGAVYLYVAWQGTWDVESGAEQRKGFALFDLRGRPLKLAEVVRGSPFSQPE
jgi:hypothetical protein